MSRIVIAATAAFFAATAHAQQPSPAKTAAGVECPSVADQQARVNERHKDGTEAKPAIPAERSGILPSGGNYDESSAPTVAQSGQVMPSPIDCPLKPGHPNAVNPGAQQADMPTQSK